MAEIGLSTSEAAARLGVTESYLRNVAQQGRWGAHKPAGERGWHFDAKAINAEAERRNRPAPITVDPVLDAADASTWELERQLLIAQASAAETRAELAELRAEIAARDHQIVAHEASIAALQTELGRARTELTRMATFVHSAAADHLPET